MGNHVDVLIPEDVRNRAKLLKINVSKICREALAEEELEKEKESIETKAGG